MARGCVSGGEPVLPKSVPWVGPVSRGHRLGSCPGHHQGRPVGTLGWEWAEPHRGGEASLRKPKEGREGGRKVRVGSCPMGRD